VPAEFGEPGRAVVKIRPEAEQRLHAGFQRRVDEQRGAHRLRTADGQAHEISRSFKNVQDPYLEMGQLFRHLAPTTIGTTMPTFPTIDQIIAAYAKGPGPGA
jgi:hypothetical protein